MFKLALFVFSLCCGIFALANAGVYTEKYFKDPSHPGKCTIRNKVLAPGQSIKHPVMQCAQLTCDDAQGSATIETCDPVHALASPLTQLNGYDRKNPPKCTWNEELIDASKPFPECCKRRFTCVF